MKCQTCRLAINHVDGKLSIYCPQCAGEGLKVWTLSSKGSSEPVVDETPETDRHRWVKDALRNRTLNPIKQRHITKD